MKMNHSASPRHASKRRSRRSPSIGTVMTLALPGKGSATTSGVIVHLTPPHDRHVADSAAIVCIGSGSGDCQAPPRKQSPGPGLSQHLFFRRSTMKPLIHATAILGLALAPAVAEAKGCIKG